MRRRLGEPRDHALGRSRGGFTTKLHLVTDGTGLPLAVALSAGQAHESRYLEQVLDAVHLPPRTGGRRRRRPGALAGDKGYSYPRIRQWLRAHHVRAVIPERSDQLRQRAHRPGRALYHPSQACLSDDEALRARVHHVCTTCAPRMHLDVRSARADST